MKTLKTLLVSASLLSLSACATIIEGSRDSINISTSPPTNATCTLSNARGSYSTYTPASAAVKKSRSDIQISCVDANTGARGQSTVTSDVEPWAFGNILWGLSAPIALGIDWSTGAAYNYPEATVVPMTAPMASAPATNLQPVGESATAPIAAQPAYAAPAQPALAPATIAPAYAPATAPTLVPAPAGAAPQSYEYIPPSQLNAPQAAPAQR